jgi:hypothetical protein
MALPTIQQLARARVTPAVQWHIINPMLSYGVPSTAFVDEAIRLVELVMQTPVMRVQDVDFVDPKTICITTDRGLLYSRHRGEAILRSYEPLNRRPGAPRAVPVSLNDRKCLWELSSL